MRALKDRLETGGMTVEIEPGICYSARTTVL